MNTTRTLLAAAVLAALLSACGKAQDKAAEVLAEQALSAGSGQDVDIRSEDGQQQVTINTGEGQLQHTTGENVPLPADFPADVVLPEGYSVVSVMKMGPALSVVLRSDAPAAELYEHFKSGQAGEGWTETLSMQGAEGSMLGFEKAKRGLLINFSDDMQGRTMVSMSLQSP